MPILSESAIEELAIELLKQQGFAYLHSSIIAFDGEAPQRSSYADVILEGRLTKAIDRLNSDIPAAQRMLNRSLYAEFSSSPEVTARQRSWHQSRLRLR